MRHDFNVKATKSQNYNIYSNNYQGTQLVNSKIIMMTDKQTIKPQFAWHKIDTQLRFKNSQTYRKISLKPNFTIALQNSSKYNLQTRLHIDIEKSLQYQESIGWNWHKSSDLPIFSLKLTVFDNLTSKILIPPKLQAQIYAVKIIQNSFEKNQNLYLEDIGIKGQNHIELQEGCGSFNSLRFCSTSYNNEGAKFHLVIVVFTDQKKSQVPENIVCSVISPPIFVDSRKSARNYQEKKYLSFVELFNPTDLQKLFAKRQNKEEPEDKKIITNDDEGLYNYLTAPNIRHKVKHPLFLSVKFSNAFKIFVNTKSNYFSQKELTLNNVINRLQKKLIKQVGIIRRKKQSQSFEEKQFVIVMEFSSMETDKDKITQMLQYLECYSICVLQKGHFLQKDFIDISKLGDVISVYRMEYFSLKRKSEKQIQDRKSLQIKKQEEQYFVPKQNQFYQKPKSLFERIKENRDEEFSNSYQNQNELIISQHEKAIKQNRYSTSITFGMGSKKIKPNQTQLIPKNNIQSKYPLQDHFLISPKNEQIPTFNQNYRGFMFNISGINQNGQVKKQEQSYIYVSEEQVVQKIQEMCVQVYQRNKKSILNYLQTLKKSNVKWRVKDIEHFIFSYSSALMNEIFFREKLLHHMLLENEILKAKVGIMQQMALSDLQRIKGNIMAMNRFLPEKFITEKLRQNSLWIQDLPAAEKKALKVAEIRSIESRPKQVKQQEKKDAVIIQSNINKTGSKMIEEVSSSEEQNQSFKYECNFIPNVFQLESPSFKE